jgi:hypothetical protein
MAVSDLADLLSALQRRDFERLLGTEEAEWIDFKKEPYRLDEHKGKWEYAKDVAAFANVGGGAIVIGVKTDQSVTELQSKAASYQPIPKNLVNRKSYFDVLAGGVYPDVIGVRLSWFPDDPALESGLLLIEVPKQSERDRPFIVSRMLGPTDNPTVAVGIPIREGGDTRWMRPERLHALVATAAARPGEQASVASTAAAAEARALAERSARADARVELVCNEIESDGDPSYVLQAIPPGPPTFISDLHDAVRTALEYPSSLRGHLGFNVKFGEPLSARDGGLASLGSRHAIVLDRDALLTYGVNAGPRYLGWGINERKEGPPFHINSLALVETTLEFYRTVYMVLAPRVPAGHWAFRIVGRGWSRAGLALAPGVPQGAWMHRAAPASSDTLDERLPGTGSAPEDAFRALQRVYGVFGLPPSAIPFTANGMISEDDVKRR